MTTPREALAPCPFCGGKPHADFERDPDYLEKGFMSYKCRGCLARSGTVYGSGDPSEWADARAIWNRRTPSASRPLRQLLTTCDDHEATYGTGQMLIATVRKYVEQALEASAPEQAAPAASYKSPAGAWSDDYYLTPAPAAASPPIAQPVGQDEAEQIAFWKERVAYWETRVSELPPEHLVQGVVCILANRDAADRFLATRTQAGAQEVKHGD